MKGTDDVTRVEAMSKLIGKNKSPCTVSAEIPVTADISQGKNFSSETM